MEPGGSLWLWRFGAPQFEQLLVPRSQLPRFRSLLAAHRTDDPRDLPLVRRAALGHTQRLTIPAGDLDRVREAIRELWRFEANPELPEWKERGYLTEAEAEAVAAEHPEWFVLDDDPDAGPEPGQE
jgi:hypothetical protein